MYINPVLAGVLGTIFVEGIIIILGSLLAYLDSKGEERDGENNNNQSNQ